MVACHRTSPYDHNYWRVNIIDWKAGDEHTMMDTYHIAHADLLGNDRDDDDDDDDNKLAGINNGI